MFQTLTTCLKSFEQRSKYSLRSLGVFFWNLGATQLFFADLSPDLWFQFFLAHFFSNMHTITPFDLIKLEHSLAQAY